MRARDPSLRPAAEIENGEQRAVRIRAGFDEFMAAQRKLASASEQRSMVASRRAMAMAGAAALGSFALVSLFTCYLARALVRPVRRDPR